MIIRITNIDGILISGQTELIVTDQYSQRIGFQEELFLTDAKYQLTNESASVPKEQRVQALVYDKYRIRFITRELYWLDLMKYGDVEVEYDNAYTIHKAIVTDVIRNNISGDYWSFEIEYYDLNPANYLNNTVPVINYLRSDFIYNTVPFDQTTVLRAYGTGGVGVLPTVQSILRPKFTTDAPEGDTFENKGLNVRPYTVLKQYIDCVFYLNTEDKQKILEPLSLVGNNKTLGYIISYSKQYTLFETPQWEVTDVNGADIWQLKVKAVYNTVNHYEYDTVVTP